MDGGGAPPLLLCAERLGLVPEGWAKSGRNDWGWGWNGQTFPLPEIGLGLCTKGPEASGHLRQWSSQNLEVHLSWDPWTGEAQE